MFLTIEDFATTLLTRSPAIALLDWEERQALTSFVERLPGALQACQSDILLATISAGQLNSHSFSQQLLNVFDHPEVGKTCLLVMEIEPMTSKAAEILNGYREHLATFKAVVITIRNNRRRDFIMHCPDLMDWVTPSLVGCVEDLGPPVIPFTLEDVEHSLRVFEERYQLSSDEFHRQYVLGQVNHIAEAWFWAELLRIHQDLAEDRT
jgi:hypothetical protein